MTDRSSRDPSDRLGTNAKRPGAFGRAHQGEGDMARHQIADIEGAVLGQANAASDMFLELGMLYSTGRTVPADLVAAHKWFNLAAMRGNKDAVRLRLEIAAEMTEADIAAAQRAARDWLA